MTHILVALAPGFEEMEAVIPIDVWKRAAFDVTSISVNNSKNVEGAHNITVIADKLISEINFDQSDMIFLPGGMPGAQNLDNCQQLKKALIDFDKQKKTLGAICAAPMVLGHCNILNQKKATCFPGFENELYGAVYTGANVQTHQHIITAKGAGIAMQFALEVVAHFNGSDFANNLAKKMLVK
jgi:4-methyl-5(b-hydroxyethyl)-thiazole monophosphate biosynthesis